MPGRASSLTPRRSGTAAAATPPTSWGRTSGTPRPAVRSRATTSNEPPDFAARAKDPAFGGALPEGKVFDGVPLLHFDGYSEDKDGAPTFRYHLQAGTDDRLDVSEHLESLRSGAAAGVARQFLAASPGAASDAGCWPAKAPRSRDCSTRRGAPLALDLKSGTAETPAAGKALVLPQDGDHVVVLRLPAAPDGAVWRVQKGGAGWIALVRLPAAADATQAAD